jgi:agmatine deiminase
MPDVKPHPALTRPSSDLRLPAEWEPQAAVLLAWPRSDGDWTPYLAEVEPAYRGLAAAIARHAQLIVLADDAPAVGAQLAAAGIPADRASVVPTTTNDTWTRDYGPLTVLESGRPRLMDFTFTGWGLKYPADQDNQATRRLHAAGLLGAAPLTTVGLALEGGGVESDGQGTILTTSACQLSPNRNPHLDRAGIEAALAAHLGAQRVLWLDHGHLEGDDTDAHIDTVARLCPDDTILYVRCDDPADSHFTDFAAMEGELAALRTAAGTPYRLVPLPWAAPRFAPDDGRRLPATYANILFLNGAVLVPTYREPARDAAALAAVRAACPGFTVEGVDCDPLILQHGSLHCATMQLPVEIWSWKP